MHYFAGLAAILNKTRFFIVAILLLLISACQPSVGKEDSVFSDVRNNDATALSQYLGQEGDPNIMNGDGDSLLYVASGAKGGLEVVKLLVEGGADLNQISREGRTALHTASAWCNTDIVALLLEAGARTDIKNSENNVAIDVVCGRPRQRREQVLVLFFKAETAQ